MTETTQHVARNRRRLLPVVAAAMAALAIAVAGCGGGTSTAATPASGHQAGPAAGASGIPQHNGGDMDADNNGGPSDGDGNL